MRLHPGLLAVLAIAVLLAGAVSAFSQVNASGAQLNGTVRDESGGVIVKATVNVREVDTNRSYTSTSNDSGFYVLPNLPPGRYELTVSFPGFAKYTQKEIVLTVGQTATLTIDLRVASKGEQVVVTEEAEPIEPTKTETSQVIDTKQIGSLPISGRLFTDFALLSPGVSTGRTSLGSTITEFEITRISFGGQRDFSNTITVDGADNTNTVTGSQRAAPAQEAVAEFRVVNNSFSAEYGRALGGIVNIVTKSGTNNWHGSIYDYLQNDVTNATSLLTITTIPRSALPQNVLRQNQFGATLGGPIQKDKTFFFMNYEGQRRGESPTYPPLLVSELTLINTAKTLMGIAPENLNLLKTKHHDYGIVKVDHQFNDKYRISLRYNIEDARDLNALVGNTLDGGGIGTPSGGRNISIRDQSLVVNLNTQLKPNLINSTLVQWARRHYNFPGATGQPDLSLPNQLEFGHNFGVLDAIYESRGQFSDSLAWVKGNHVAKFGVDINYIRDSVIWPGFTPTRIILPGINCLVDFANFVNPAPTAANQLASDFAQGPCPVASFPFFPPAGTIGANPNDALNGDPATFWAAPIGTGAGASVNGTIPPPINTNWQNAFRPDQRQNFYYALYHSYFGFFAQDQWRVTPKLTVNYGLRYEFETGLGNVINSNYKGFQPRVGLAYSPDKHTVIRAGFGLFDDRQNLIFYFITGPQRAAQFPVPLLFTQTGSNSAPYALNILQPGPPAAIAGYGLPATVAKQIVLTGTFPPTYVVGSCAPPFTAATNTANCTTNAGGLDKHAPIPYSEQGSLEIDREIGKGLTLSIGYLFVGAHHQVRGNNLNMGCPVGTTNAGSAPFNGILNTNGTIGNCTGTPTLVLGKPFFSPTGMIPPSLAVGPGAEFTNSGLLDFNNNVANTAYHGVTFQVAEKWGKILRLNANYTFSKTIDNGTFTTFISLAQNQFDYKSERGLSNQDARHRFVANFLLAGPEKSLLRHFELSSIITLQSGRPFTEFVGFDSNNDANPVTDRVGTIARNTYTGDGLYTIDLRISRYFQLRERLRLEVSVDAFNMLNRPNVDEVSSVYGVPGFCGAVPKQYKDAASLALQAGTVPCPFGTFPAPLPPIPEPSKQFGTPRTVFNPRQFQLAAKLSF